MKDVLNAQSDEELVKVVCGSDQERYRELVERYQDRLLRYAASILQDNEAASDVVQESFIKAFINLKGFNPSHKFSSWIYRIVHNESINFAKKKKPIILEPEDWEKVAENETWSMESQWEKEEIRLAVQNSLAKLPYKYRTCMALHFLEDKSYEDISEILELPLGTVGTNISRGKKMIKALLNQLEKQHA